VGDIGMDELHAHAVAYKQAGESANDSAFGDWR